MIQLFGCGTTEKFEGKKATVHFKDVMYEGKPALLVVDPEATVVQENKSTIEVDGNSVTLQSGTTQVKQPEDEQQPESEQPESEQPEGRRTYTSTQATLDFNTNYDYSTCASFQSFMDDPSLSITDVTISELLPDYEKYDIDSNVDATLIDLNKARGDKLAVCRETFEKVVSAFDTFTNDEKLTGYEKKPSGEGCGEYKSISFSSREKENDMKKVSAQFDTPEYDTFRNSILKKERETMKLVNEKHDACLLRFVMRPADKVKILSGRNYLYYDDGLKAKSGRRYAQSWRLGDIIRGDNNENVAVLIESDNKRRWKANNGLCISLDDTLSLQKCDESDEKQHFKISTLKDKKESICHVKENKCLKKEKDGVIARKLNDTDASFGWTLRKTY